MYEYDPPIVRWGAWIISHLKRQNTSFLAEVAVVLVDEIQYFIHIVSKSIKRKE